MSRKGIDQSNSFELKSIVFSNMRHNYKQFCFQKSNEKLFSDKNKKCKKLLKTNESQN